MIVFKIDDKQELICTGNDTDEWILHINNIPQLSTPTKLFKFYSLSAHNLDAIKNAYFYLNNAKEFNDPFDCSFNLVREDRIIPELGNYVPIHNDVQNKGICCFSTVEANPLMWSHYTDAYNGFAVRFNPNFRIRINDQINGHRLMRVVYSANPNIISKSMTCASAYQLGVKLSHWSYENEWRLVVDKAVLDLRKIEFELSDKIAEMTRMKQGVEEKKADVQSTCERMETELVDARRQTIHDERLRLGRAIADRLKSAAKKEGFELELDPAEL